MQILTLFGNVQGGMVEALSIYRKWKGYSLDYEGSKKLLFSLKEPNSFLVKNNAIRISTEPNKTRDKGWDFEIRGYFPDKSCSIVDSQGNVIAQVAMYSLISIIFLSFTHTCTKPSYIYNECNMN